MALLHLLITILATITTTTTSQSSVCRTSCGPIPIYYPFGIDPGCGHPHFHHLLSCTPSSSLPLLRTPSGSYPIHRLSYSDPHLVVSDPSLFSCSHFPPSTSPSFSLDSSTPLSLSSKNDFLFFNCSPDSVLIRPKPPFCDHFPDRCDSSCDSAAYLCRNLPGCPDKLRAMELSCCSYFPTASESVRMMLRHCAGGYTSLYWRMSVGDGVEQEAEYGIRVDFELPVTTRCRVCRERGGGGTCGFDMETKGFLCLCNEGNVTTYCGDSRASGSRTPAGVVAGTTTVVSVAGLSGVGALVWYLRKKRSNKVVTCGVQTTENRLF